jgi:hypothetical protein
MSRHEKYWCKIPVSVPWRSTGQFRDLRIWLLDNILNMDYDYYGVDFVNPENRIYYFARDQDAAMFALRWS